MQPAFLVAFLAVSPVAGACCLRRADGVGLGLRRRRRVFAAGASAALRFSCIPCVPLAVRCRRGGSAVLASLQRRRARLEAMQGVQGLCARHQASLTKTAQLG